MVYPHAANAQPQMPSGGCAHCGGGLQPENYDWVITQFQVMS